MAKEHKRVPISKKLRFEVFKRDSFKCQYCGGTAPDVILHADHIIPVAEGGKTDIINLVTSCEPCNLGKGATPLSDDAAVTKARTQLELLQERREQLEMMVEWQSGLANLESDSLAGARAIWYQISRHTLTPSGISDLKKLISKYSVSEVMEAMRVAAKYLVTGKDGSIQTDSVNFAFGKLSGICYIAQQEKKDPEIKDLFSIRAGLRARFPGKFIDYEALNLLKDARAKGIPVGHIRVVSDRSRSYWAFKCEIDDLIESLQPVPARR